MENSVCFTGHRPEKLISPFYEQSREIQFLKDELKVHIQQAIIDGYVFFYSGVARGVDIFASEIVLGLKQQYPIIKHIAVIPYREQSVRWSESWKVRYSNIITSSDLCVYLNEEYHQGCLMQRNRYLVNNTQRIIAVYNGESGGTKYTLDYAKKHNKEIVMIDYYK